MKFVRIYPTADGESHFEDVEVPLAGRGASQLSETVRVSGLVFRRTGPEYNLDWHPAPRRQFVVNLVGAVEIEASDGEVRRLGPGSILLAEDTSGKGHISRAVDGVERLSLFIHLAD